MSRIVHRPLVLQDLDNVWDYVAQDNPQIADHFIDKVEKQCRLLAEFPNIGTRCDSLYPAYVLWSWTRIFSFLFRLMTVLRWSVSCTVRET